MTDQHFKNQQNDVQQFFLAISEGKKSGPETFADLDIVNERHPDLGAAAFSLLPELLKSRVAQPGKRPDVWLYYRANEVFPDVIVDEKSFLYQNADVDYPKALAAFSDLQEKVRSSRDHDYSLSNEGALSGFCKACEITMGYNLFAVVVGASVHKDCAHLTGIHFEHAPAR